MRVVFAGTPEAAVPSLRTLLGSSHEVLAVLTRPDAPTGRGRRLRPSPVKAVADEHGLEVLAPRSTREPELASRLQTLAPDAAPVVAYGGLIPPGLLRLPVHGWVNLHFSLLPAWRGAAPVQHAIMAGDDVSGATTFLLDEGLDRGAVLGMLTERLREDDTAGSALERLAEAGAELLLASLDALESGTVQAQPQSGEGVSHAPKLSVEDARICWDRPAYAVDRQVRACTPSPGAWTTWRSARLGVAPVTPVEQPSSETDRALAPGQVHVSKREVVVGTGHGSVRLGQVQPPGRQRLDASDWARGARVGADERFGGDL